MKITCDSCQAKYTIADEKVVGKIVKIKCKKCGTTIVVNGNEAAANGGMSDAPVHSNGGAALGAPAEDEWTVNVSDDDQRTMSTQQLVDDYKRGVVTNDTYVWKDGMSDWLPISDVAELAGQLGVGASAPTPLGLGGTAVIGNTGGGGISPFAAPRAAAASPFSSPAPAAARRASGGRGGAGVDVFGAAAEQATGPSSQDANDRAVGERNENSVLFSLSALTATENAMKAQAGRSNEEASIDFGTSPAPRNGGGSRGGFDDIMNLGGGMSGGLSGPMLAPPPILAPVVEAPAPPPAPVSAMPSAMPGAPMMQYAPPPAKSKTGLIVGILLGVGVIAGAAFFLGSSSKPDATSTPESPVAATPTPTETQAATPPPADTQAAPPPADTSQAAAASTGDPASTGAVAANNPGGKVGGPLPAGGKPKDEPKAEAKPEPKAEAKPAETSAPTGGNKEFNRGAASAALGGAAGAARGCKKPDGPTGSGKVKVTFAPSGNVTSASVVGAPFAGTSVGGCVASAFRGAKVPPFDGSPVSVTKSFSIN